MVDSMSQYNCAITYQLKAASNIYLVDNYSNRNLASPDDSKISTVPDTTPKYFSHLHGGSGIQWSEDSHD